MQKSDAHVWPKNVYGQIWGVASFSFARPETKNGDFAMSGESPPPALAVVTASVSVPSSEEPKSVKLATPRLSSPRVVPEDIPLVGSSEPVTTGPLTSAEEISALEKRRKVLADHVSKLSDSGQRRDGDFDPLF